MPRGGISGVGVVVAVDRRLERPSSCFRSRVKLLHAARTDVGMIRSATKTTSPWTPPNRGDVHRRRRHGRPRGRRGSERDGGGHRAGRADRLRSLDGEDWYSRWPTRFKSSQTGDPRRTLTEVDSRGWAPRRRCCWCLDRATSSGKWATRRIYLLRNGSCRSSRRITPSAGQVDAGFLTPSRARYHPYSNVITRCVGAGQDVEPDIYRGEVRAGDLCPRRERRAHGNGGRPAPLAAPHLARRAGSQGPGAHRRGERARRVGQHHRDHRPGTGARPGLRRSQPTREMPKVV